MFVRLLPVDDTSIFRTPEACREFSRGSASIASATAGSKRRRGDAHQRGARNPRTLPGCNFRGLPLYRQYAWKTRVLPA